MTGRWGDGWSSRSWSSIGLCQNLDPEHGETYAVNVVTFETTGRSELTAPSWVPITDENLAELVGTPVALDRGQGVEPPSEPISRVRYDTRWVVTLPRPQPFREPDCMPEAGPSLARRLGHPLIPQRARRDCCWCHGGDWAQVSRIAIRLVHEALASDRARRRDRHLRDGPGRS
jgi:hypothetical protein